MQITGKLKVIEQTQTFKDNAFRKRNCVIVTDEQYEQTILIEFVQNNVDLLDHVMIGQKVQIDINLRGREWTNPQGETKYLNSVQGWRITSLEQTANNPHNMPTKPQPTGVKPDDDLPF